MQPFPLTFCLVTQPVEETDKQYEQFILAAVHGGVTAVQLRSKVQDSRCLVHTATRLIELLRPLNVPLIINDHVEVALAVNADGVHLGQSDMHPELAREVLGEDKFIGLSIESMANLEAANNMSCLDYVAASAIFPSKTKLDCKTFWGLDGLEQLARASRYPVVAIGGITADSAGQIMQAGAAGIAVVSALYEAACVKSAARLFSLAIKRVG